MSIFIHDGYTLKGVIPAKGPRPALTFHYRPALAEQVREHHHAVNGTPAAAFEATISLLAKHVISWDATDREGKPTAVKSETLRRVWHDVLVAMVERVCGYTFDEQQADAGN